MTDQEWLTATNRTPMLLFLRDRASDRKLRLFAVGCCRALQDMLVPEAHEAIEVAEGVAEKTVGEEHRRRTRDMAFRLAWVLDPSTRHLRGPSKAAVCDALSRGAWDAAINTAWRTNRLVTRKIEVLWDIFGNPFRPLSLDRSCRTSSVTKLAQTIYDDRQMPSVLFDNQRMAVLADALEDAGCDNADILGHLRAGGDHVRGCWAVDLVLGKT